MPLAATWMPAGFNPRPPPTRRATAPPPCMIEPEDEFQPTPSADAESDPELFTRAAYRTGYNPRPPPTRRATTRTAPGAPGRRGFNPRPPPTRRATHRHAFAGARPRAPVSTHALRRRGGRRKSARCLRPDRRRRFNPRPPPTRRATIRARARPSKVSTHALPHMRRGRPTSGSQARPRRRDVSTHALRRRGERPTPAASDRAEAPCFNPRPPPTRRATCSDSWRGIPQCFNPRPPPTRRATPSGPTVAMRRRGGFNPRPPPTRRATRRSVAADLPRDVSTHALRRRGERPVLAELARLLDADVSTHALRRRGERRGPMASRSRAQHVSTHALRRRGERPAPCARARWPRWCFNPRPPPTRRATAPGATARKDKPIEALFANPAPREPGGRLVPPRDTRNGRGSAHIQAARTSRTWSTGRGSRAAGQKTSGPDGSIGRRTPWCSVRADASSRRK